MVALETNGHSESHKSKHRKSDDGHKKSKTKEEPKKVKVESESEKEEEEEEEEFKVHENKHELEKKRFSRAADDMTKEKDYKLFDFDVKSKEVVERGDFKNFNLPKNIVSKLKGYKNKNNFLKFNFLIINCFSKIEKNINYLYPNQIATLEHIRSGHDIIAQASKSISA